MPGQFFSRKQNKIIIDNKEKKDNKQRYEPSPMGIPYPIPISSVILGVVRRGALIIFRYARRWGDRRLEASHYDLKRVKSVRNCAAHGSCLINCFKSIFIIRKKFMKDHLLVLPQ